MGRIETRDNQSYLFHGGKLFDPRRDELVENVEVLVEDGRVKAVARPTEKLARLCEPRARHGSASADVR